MTVATVCSDDVCVFLCLCLCLSVLIIVMLKIPNPTLILAMFYFTLLAKLGFFWTNFHETLYWIFLKKSLQEIQSSFKCDNNNQYFT
jgi:hypothetical protein